MSSSIYGCFNKRAKDSYRVLVRRVITREVSRPTIKLVTKSVPNRMSKDCRYDNRLTDSKCRGCLWQTVKEDLVTHPNN